MNESETRAEYILLTGVFNLAANAHKQIVDI